MAKKSEVRIVILQRGWVAVGRYVEKGSDCVLLSASIIRRWGTTKGLGELVTGPLGNTVLDPVGVMRFHALAVVATIDCEEAKWTAHLK